MLYVCQWHLRQSQTQLLTIFAFRYLAVVEWHKDGPDCDIPLSQAGLWIKWRSGTTLLSQVPPSPRVFSTASHEWPLPDQI